MWRVFALLFIVFPFSVFAECVPVDQVTKCARLPSYLNFSNIKLGESTSNSWSVVAYDSSAGREVCYWSGEYAEIEIEESMGPEIEATVTCYMTYPFQMTITLDVFLMGVTDPYQICSMMYSSNSRYMSGVKKLDGDMCPDGFYTVPYEIPCGEGMVDVSGVPQCEDDTSGDYCLIGEVSVAPCAAGITTLRTGAGVIVPLWAEKATEPSLCVKYNDTVCYGNLEAGRAVGAINVNYNGVVYHMVD